MGFTSTEAAGLRANRSPSRMLMTKGFAEGKKGLAPGVPEVPHMGHLPLEVSNA